MSEKQHDRIWLSPPHMGGSELVHVNQAFDSNWIAPVGPNLQEFERRITEYCKVSHGVALSSGTAAIHLALKNLQISKDDYVLCQSFTFSGTVNPIIYEGAIPVFIDSERETWNLDPNLVEDAARKLGKKIKAIIPVHLYGMPAKMQDIEVIASKYGIPVIEDAAEALGSLIGEKRCGSFGDQSVLSFNGNKIITTSGGGALLSNNKSHVDHARFLSTQARDPAPHYEHSQIGYNYRMSNVVAGIGMGQMEVLGERIKQRRENFMLYQHYFSQWNEKGFNIYLQPEPKHYQSNRWLTTVVIDPDQNNGLTYQSVMEHLGRSNIESRPLWKPMHCQPVFSRHPAFTNGYSEYLFDKGLCLPSGSNLTKTDFDYIFSSLEVLFSKYQ